MAIGRGTGGHEHPVRAARESAALPVAAEQAGELGDERNLANRGGGRRRDALRRRAEEALDLGAAEHALAAPLRPRTLVVLEQLTGSATIQPQRRAKRSTLWSVASALADVFAEQPARRSWCSSSATSSTVSAATRRRPSAGSRWRSSW
jgi:hypothetical protein